ncbi:MAG TPA: ECF-type sigma factor [Pyrinomonadaceae bacterium]|nr:ECF-type sigma factor [Pyrinomonadaceae bacterium]
MDEPAAHELTELLLAWGEGDEEALARIAPLVHAELYRLAKAYMSRERPDHLLQTSALINEAYVRLIDWKAVRWQNRAHFFGVAAQMMRRILVDFARRRPRVNDKAEAIKISLGDAMDISAGKDADLLALDESLKSLAKLDERKSRIVELKLVGGLTMDEIAETIGVSRATVEREWKFARAWLYRAVAGM